VTEQQKNPTAVFDALKTFEKKLQHDQDPEHVKYMGARSVEDLSETMSSTKITNEKKLSNSSESSEPSSAKVASDDDEKPTLQHKGILKQFILQ